jgi:hypothetical protein
VFAKIVPKHTGLCRNDWKVGVIPISFLLGNIADPKRGNPRVTISRGVDLENITLRINSIFSYPNSSTQLITMAHLQASNLFSVKDRVVVITGGGSGKNQTISSYKYLHVHIS